MCSYDELIRAIKRYNPEELEHVKKAYEFAKKCHQGQLRRSGEPYIIHPVAVDNILAEFHADRDTLCAGLLHDVIEDCHVSREEIESIFNAKIAELVDGVTNLTQVGFKTRSERNYATIRKMILMTTKDARVILIKLADRLHNMRTLEYKEAKKRIEKSNETMDFYVPAARYIGAEQIRRELEDLSFKFLNEEGYKSTKFKMDNYLASKTYDFNASFKEISELLRNHGISCTFKTRVKNKYTVYKHLAKGESIDQLHDFIAIKIILNDVDSCYKALDLIRSLYPEKENTYRDYIGSPKVNGYQSIHDSFFGKNGLLFQVQIRTVDMDRRNKYGIAGLWDKYKGKAGNKMLEELMNATPFFKLIETLGKLCQTDEEFYQHLVSEILCDIISVHYDGKIMRIPANISIVDFAYRLSPDFGNQMVVARVNDRRAEYSTILHDGDSVDIGISTFAPGPEMGWLKSATTIQAQTEIRKRLSLGRG